jgi:zinc/manganese transport system substrate-binding protein
VSLARSLAAIAAGLVVALAGCSASPTIDDGRLSVVASTNVYGDLAHAVGGDLVEVVSIIDSDSQDPHEFEATARTQLALSRADIVIENGGGYDDFVDSLVAATGDDTVLLNVADISGYDQEPSGAAFNEHLWYDFPTMQKLVTRIAAELTRADPASARVFEGNAAALDAELAALETREAGLAIAHPGARAAITEPVPLYLLTACGMANLTPAGFSEAVEEDGDVPPAVLDRMLALFKDRRVDVLVYNEQTAGSATDDVLAAAKAQGIPAVGVRETLPSGSSYIEWMNADLDAIEAALG